MTYHSVKQNTEEPCPCCGKTWQELRAGKITGSAIACVMANYPNQFGDPAYRLAVEIATVQLGGRPSENNYTNAEMERGHAEEPIARVLYESIYFTEVTNGGFHENGDTGCSLDGEVAINGSVEIKSVVKHIFYKRIKSRSFDPTYKWQYIFNMKEAGKDWMDCIYYCSEMPKNKQLFVYRMLPENYKKEYQMIDKRLDRFRGYIREIKRNIVKFRSA